MLTWVSYEEICTCEYLGEKYKQISTYLNGTKNFFSGESVNITWISCQYPWISCQYLSISCQYPVNMFKYPLLRGIFFLYSRYLNMIFTGYSRYDQIFTICSCEYSQSIFWRLYEQIWIDVHRLKRLMFSPIHAVFGQDIAAYAHVKRPDSAYKGAFVFLDVNICWYLCICANICLYLCISNSGLREQRKIECMLFGGFVFTELHTAKGHQTGHWGATL